MTEFRQLSPGDLPALHHLEAEAYEPALRVSDAAFLRLIELYPDGALGVFDGARLCAFAFALPLRSGTVLDLGAPLESLPPDPDAFYIHNVVVAPDCRGRGLAVAIVTTLFELARARRLDVCELVSVQGSSPFWEQFGFAPVAAFKRRGLRP